MNEKDKKIRKQWLIMWGISLSLTIVNILLQLRFEPSLNTIPALRYRGPALSFLATVVFGFIIYHCVYKKPGTKLLTFCLIMTAISGAITPILYLKGQLQPPTYIPYYGAYLFITQVTGILWFVACWRIRQVNRKVQALSRKPTESLHTRPLS